MNITGNTLLITGGGTGIGRALAEALHARGNQIIITGRREDVLKATAAANPGMAWATLDMQDAAAVAAFGAQVVKDHPALNAVILNAGIMKAEDMKAQPFDLTAAEATIATNLLGPIRLTAALLPHLTAQPAATVMTVTSGLAFIPLTATPTYNATKAAIHSYTVSLRTQLEGKVEVIELAPPGVQTDLTPGQAHRPGYVPLQDFADAVAAQFAQTPTPSEILVDEVRPFRMAEREGKFDETLKTLTKRAAEQRAAGDRIQSGN